MSGSIKEHLAISQNSSAKDISIVLENEALTSNQLTALQKDEEEDNDNDDKKLVSLSRKKSYDDGNGGGVAAIMAISGEYYNRGDGAAFERPSIEDHEDIFKL